MVETHLIQQYKHQNMIDIDKIAKTEFTAYKIKDAESVWLDNKAYSEFEQLNENKIDNIQAHFLEQYAFAIPTSLLPEDQLCRQDKQLFYAERYGGLGVGHNGGAGRCGNKKRLQVKGIGPTPMVGQNNKQWYSYGGLSLIDAVMECINSRVLNTILPLGAVKAIGVIFTGENTAYPPARAHYQDPQIGRGALLIREAALRPGHYLPSPFFKAQKKYESSIKSDLYRTREANKNLLKQFKSDNNYILYLGRFLQNAAQQFAFSRLFRIYHGTLTASNIAFDGRWLDLTNVSFIESNQNYSLLPQNEPFFNEYNSPLKVLSELLYNYEKFNLKTLHPEPLINYYHEQYFAYYEHYFAQLIGLPNNITKKISSSSAYQSLLLIFEKTVFSDIEKKPYIPCNNEQEDVLNNTLSVIFKQLNTVIINDKTKALTKNKKPPLTAATKSLKIVFSSYHRQHKLEQPLSIFVKQCTIRAMRRLYFINVFNHGKLKHGLYQDLNHQAVAYFGSLIDEYHDLAQWIFAEDKHEQSIIFQLRSLKIYFCASTVSYIIEGGTTSSTTNKLGELTKQIEELEPSLLTINHYNLKPRLLLLLSTLCQ